MDPLLKQKQSAFIPRAKAWRFLRRIKFGIILLSSVLLFCLYVVTSAGKTPYDYFLRLAQALLNGQWWLTENLPWLNELVPGRGKFYVIYPPIPAILHIPLLFVFRNHFQQQWLAHLVGTGVALSTGTLAWRISRKISISIWMFLFAGLGTINWYHASTGSAWLLGQLSAELFLLLAINECFSKQRPFLVGLFFGMAYWSRLQVILSAPLFVYLLQSKLIPLMGKRKGGWQLEIRWAQVLKLISPVLFFIIADWTYNFIRFGTIFDVGYLKIPGILSEPWYRFGLFSPSYIPEHLRIIFAQLPIFLHKAPYIQPSWAGLAIWITTPAFIYAFRANLKDHLIQFLWLAIFLIAIVNFSHGSTGFAQFGYRFALDFYPLLFLLTIKGVGGKLAWHHWLLLSLGIAVNLWGVLWINKFDLVGW